MSKRIRKFLGFSKRAKDQGDHSIATHSSAQSPPDPRSRGQRAPDALSRNQSTPDPCYGGGSTSNLHSVDLRITNPYPGGHYILEPPSGRGDDPNSAHSSGRSTPYPHSRGQLPLNPRSSGQTTPDPRPSGQPINNGIYIITNVYQKRFVFLENPNDNTPLRGHYKSENRTAHWRVIKWADGEYSVWNVEHDRYANCGSLAQLESFVEGHSREQLWRIQERSRGQYTIAAIDNGNLWKLPYNEPDTPVCLSDAHTDPRCWWTFSIAEIAAPVDGNAMTRPVLSYPALLPAPSDGQSISGAAIVKLTSVINEAPDLLQPLGTVCEVLRVVLPMVESAGHTHGNLNALVNLLNVHLATVNNHVAKLEEDQKVDETTPVLNQDVRESLETYARELKEIYELLLGSQPTDSYLANKVTGINQNKGIMADKTRKIHEVFQGYTIALHRFAASTVDQMRQQLAQFPREFKQASEKARPNRPNAYGVQHRVCLQGTREKTIPAISKWVDDENTEKWIFFFLDVAGSGKSTVAKHMAEKWKREKRLLARFFFSRDTTNTMSTNSFCSTVANAFAVLDPEFKKHMDEFTGRPDLGLLPLEELFEGVVAGPLRAIGRRAILIIDALDECHPEQRDQLLQTLRDQHLSVPFLRILATGRPERDIKRWATEEFSFGYTNFIQLEESDKDVELYIKHRLEEFPIAQDRLYPVIQNAEGLFIWARVACDLLLDCDDINGLLEILGREVSLDHLYRVALGQSMPKEEASRRAMVLVLQILLAAREPLSIAELEKLSPKRGIVEKVVTRLGSVLLYQGREDPIRLLHATFREFLTTRSRADIFFIQPELGHHTPASGCLNIISYISKQDHTTLRNVDRISDRKMIP